MKPKGTARGPRPQHKAQGHSTRPKGTARGPRIEHYRPSTRHSTRPSMRPSTRPKGTAQGPRVEHCRPSTRPKGTAGGPRFTVFEIWRDIYHILRVHAIPTYRVYRLYD